jgi:hypothetical protein
MRSTAVSSVKVSTWRRISMSVLPVPDDGGGGGQIGIFKPESECGLVKVEAEVSTVEAIQSAICKPIGLLALAELCTFGEIVRGYYSLIQVIIEFVGLLVHSFCLLSGLLTKISGRKSRLDCRFLAGALESFQIHLQLMGEAAILTQTDQDERAP